jgi:hypothetical protein
MASSTVTLGTTMDTESDLHAPVSARSSRDIDTRSTYRALLIRSLRPPEAANLTAYLCGIPVGRQPWRIDEINRLLFLRDLYAAGRFLPGRSS